MAQTPLKLSEPSANVTEEKEHVELRENTIFLFPDIWSEAPESTIQVGEDDIKQAVELPICVIVAVKMTSGQSKIAETSETIEISERVV